MAGETTCPHCGSVYASPQTADIDLSVVVPAYNEQETLGEFYRVLSAELDRLALRWELIVVNDGSRDRTESLVRELCARDPRVKGVLFSRNFGHQLAITAGMSHAVGRVVVTMDADLQHPPSMIPEMLRLWREGNQVVYTVRTYGKEIGRFKRWSSDVFYRVINKLSDIELIPGAADFRLLDRSVVDYLNAMPENARFVRGMVAWLGFRQVGIPYQAAPRFAGQSKFSLVKMLGLAIEGITSFSVKPLRWSMYLGFFFALSVIPYTVYAIYQHFFTNQTVPGWSSLIVAISFLGAVQLIFLGVIGEYIGRIYSEVKHRPLYTVQERLGFRENQETLSDSPSIELRKVG